MRTLALTLGVWLCAPGAMAEFRAAAVKIDITPDEPLYLRGYAERISNGVHDRIYHRIAAFDDGKTQFFLASSDLCVFTPAYYDETCRELEKQTGIRPGQVWWTLTHTHAAPEIWPPGLALLVMPERYRHPPNHAYTERVRRTLIAGIRQARERLEPARLAVGTGFSTANINRRARDIQGKVTLGMNPDGPVDRVIGLIRLERPDGSPIALVANYAMHGTVGGPKNLKIGGDAQGAVSGYVESKLGAPMLYINGAAGDIAPLYSGQADFGTLDQFKVMLGNRILEADRALPRATPAVALWTGETWIETPRKAGYGWLDHLKDYLRVVDGDRAMIRLPVRFLKVNDDLAVWAAPLELFCEIAIQVRGRSPFPRTFYFGYANGTLGYLPTRQALSEGGYEIDVTPFTERAGEDFAQGVTAYLQGMR
jgi:neutral ceramidase